MKLSDNYRIKTDKDNTILEFFEQRQRKVVAGEEPKFYEHTEEFFYPNLKTALKAFLQKTVHGLETAQLILKRIGEVEAVINSIEK